MPTTFDFNFRHALSEFHGGARLHVLLAMMLHANVRNRCWPSMRGLAKETGYALAAVNDAKNWLEEHGAIEIVKYDQRIGEEKTPKINHLVNVYQLTGVIKFGDVTYPVLYVPQSDTSNAYVPQNETSRNETLICDTEVVTSVKPVQKREENKKKKDSLRAAHADGHAPTFEHMSQAEFDALSGDEVVDILNRPLLDGKPQNSAQARNVKGKTKATAKDTPPPSRSARVSPKSDSAALFLAKALGLTPVEGDWAKFGRVASQLNKAGITCEEFEGYVVYWREMAKRQNWTLGLHALTGGVRMSEYVAWRDANSGYARWLKNVVPVVLGRKTAEIEAEPTAPVSPEQAVAVEAALEQFLSTFGGQR